MRPMRSAPIVMTAVLFVAVLSVATSSRTLAAADTDRPETELMHGPGGFLVDHTLIFPGGDGQEHLIHFTRFGTFDWYFPCQIETGEWSLSADQILQLTYDSRLRAPRAFQLTQDADGLVLAERDHDTTIVAQLVEGDRLPYG